MPLDRALVVSIGCQKVNSIHSRYLPLFGRNLKASIDGDALEVYVRSKSGLHLPAFEYKQFPIATNLLLVYVD